MIHYTHLSDDILKAKKCVWIIVSSPNSSVMKMYLPLKVFAMPLHRTTKASFPFLVSLLYMIRCSLGFQ